MGNPTILSQEERNILDKLHNFLVSLKDDILFRNRLSNTENAYIALPDNEKEKYLITQARLDIVQKCMMNNTFIPIEHIDWANKILNIIDNQDNQDTHFADAFGYSLLLIR